LLIRPNGRFTNAGLLMSDAPMTDTTMDERPADAIPQPLHILRQAREQQGLDLAVLSVALKVSTKKIEALEAGRFDELPGNTFARALAASACRQLKIDPAPVLALIPQPELPRLGYADTSVDEPFHSPTLTGARSVIRLSRPALVAAVLLVLGAAALVFWPAAKPDATAVTTGASSPAEPAPTAPPPVEAASPLGPATTPQTTGMLAPNPLAASVGVATPAAASPANPTPIASPSVASANGAAAAAQPVAGAVSQMSIRATSDSWVEVSGVGGTVLLRRMLKTGEVVDFNAPMPYKVLLGRADAAQVMVRGQPFDTQPFARSSVARFEVQ
jgi:cytoskeleton protein RodZ